MTDDLVSVANGDFHRRDPLARILIVVALLSLFVAVIITGLVLTRETPGPWDPLGDYPQQTTSKLVYHLGDTVDTTAKKCARQDGVTVRSARAWKAVDDPGVVVQFDTGTGNPRYRSCGPDRRTAAYRFRNLVPDAVVALVKSGAARIWRITGTDTPYDASGREGVPRSWSTNPFMIVP